jgi:arsenate reductase (thioredoxin)
MTTTAGLPLVLFVCIRNAGRSQMAEALFNRVAEGRALARSAGSRPAEAVQPEVAESLAEIGLDISGAKPKGLEPHVLEGVDVVVGMGCGDECPLVPGAKRIDWEVPDPHGLGVVEIRGIRKYVEQLVGRLYREVVGEGVVADRYGADL